MGCNVKTKCYTSSVLRLPATHTFSFMIYLIFNLFHELYACVLAAVCHNYRLCLVSGKLLLARGFLFQLRMRLKHLAHTWAIQGGRLRRSPPLKPTKVILFTMILHNSENTIH